MIIAAKNNISNVCGEFIEWIQGDGTSYIDTGFIPTDPKTIIEITASASPGHSWGVTEPIVFAGREEEF